MSENPDTTIIEDEPMDDTEADLEEDDFDPEFSDEEEDGIQND